MRDSLQLLLVAAVVLCVGFLAYTQIFGSEAAEALTIRSLQGEVVHATAEGELQAEVGSTLNSSDRILTSDGSRVELSLGERAELTLEGGSALAVVGSDADGVRVELEDGLVQAVVRRGAGPGLAVVTGDRIARAEDAEFSVGLGLDGTAAVEARAGRVTLVNYGDVSTLEAGQRVTALAGQRPLVEDIPKSLLLEVAWPTEATRASESALLGNTQPGAIVWTDVGGKRLRAVADSQGRFEIRGVPLSEGENDIEVLAQGVLGGEESAQGQVSRDSEAPTGAFKVEY